MSGTPEIRVHPLASAGGLAGELLGSRAGAAALLPAGALDGPAGARSGHAAKDASPADGRPPARLPVEAFGRSGPEADERLRAILAGEGTLVATGQQPLLFLGPLYVLYKAISALELARRIEARTGRPALAFFWVASDDHDWEEIGTTRLIDARNEMAELRLHPPAGWDARPAGLAPLPPEISRLVDELFQLVPETEFSGQYFDLFRGAWIPDRPLGEAFARTLSGVLGDRPYAWLDAGSPAVKRAAAPLFAASLRRAGEEADALAAGAGRIVARGHRPPIPSFEGATNVFYDTGTARERLYREGERIRAGRDGEARALEEVLEQLETEPGRFGPNVALRPVLESWLLPVGAAVLGPGELAYWSQLSEMFDLHGAVMPALRPRHAWLLVESKVRKVLEKLDAEPGALADGGEEVARRAVREARPPEVEAALGDLRAALGRAMDAVEEAVGAHLPGIRSAVGKARSEAFRAATELEGQVDARLRERREVVLEQIRKAALHLHPGRRPQERVQNPLYYLARYGPGLLEALGRRSREVSPPLWPED